MNRDTKTSEIMSLRGLNRSPVTKRSSLQLMYEISKTRNVCKAQYTAVVFYKFSTILEILIYNKRYWGMEIDPQSW